MQTRLVLTEERRSLERFKDFKLRELGIYGTNISAVVNLFGTFGKHTGKQTEFHVVTFYNVTASSQYSWRVTHYIRVCTQPFSQDALHLKVQKLPKTHI